MKIKVISKSKSGTLASDGVFIHEIVEDAKALSRVWELFGGLVKKYHLVHSSAEMPSFKNIFIPS